MTPSVSCSVVVCLHSESLVPQPHVCSQTEKSSYNAPWIELLSPYALNVGMVQMQSPHGQTVHVGFTYGFTADYL